MTCSIRPQVMLVYPPHELPIRRHGRYYTPIPLGIAYLASSLEAKGFSVAAVDCNIESLSPGQLGARIAEISPSVVGISVTSPSLRYVKELIDDIRGRGDTSGIRDYGGAGSSDLGRPGPQGRARMAAGGALRPGVGGALSPISGPLIAVGGPHIAADPETSSLLGADVLFSGEVERAFAGYCQAAVAGETPPSGTIRCAESADLDALPYPARHLFHQESYRFTSLAASRGCPFQCSYCGMAGTRIRRRSVGNISREVESLAAGRPKSIDFADDVFTFDRQYALDIAAVMKPHGIPWACTSRADLVDADLLAHLADSGCAHISFGVESGNEKVRHYAGKAISDETYVAAFRACHYAGLKTRAYFIIGLPGETRITIRETVDFTSLLEPDEVEYSPATPYPGTRLHRQAVSEHAIGPQAWTDYMMGCGGLPAYTPGGFTAEDIAQACYDASKRFYLAPKRIWCRFKSASTLQEASDAAWAAAAYFIAPTIR